MSELSVAKKERPFPWRCPTCRRKDVWRVTIPYECSLMHEGQAVKVVVPSFHVPKCASCGELLFDYVADEELGLAFAAATKQVNAVTASANASGEKPQELPEPTRSGTSP